jgi:hypothetical protein
VFLGGFAARAQPRSPKRGIPEMQTPWRFGKYVGWKIDDLVSILQEYTSVIETNREALEVIFPKHEQTDWPSDVQFVPTEEQLREVTVGVEELEKYA